MIKFTTILTLSAVVLLSSCAQYGKYRSIPDPHAARFAENKKATTKAKAKKKSGGGFFSFYKKFRSDPSTWNKKQQKVQAPVVAANPSKKLRAVRRPVTSRTTPYRPRITRKVAQPTISSGRKVHGLIEPSNVTKLPDADKLKETETKTKKKATAPSIRPIE